MAVRPNEKPKNEQPIQRKRHKKKVCVFLRFWSPAAPDDEHFALFLFINVAAKNIMNRKMDASFFLLGQQKNNFWLCL